MKKKFFFAISVCLFLAGAMQAQNILRVDETKTTAVIQANSLNVNILLENSFRAFQAEIKLEILDASDSVLTKSETVKNLKSGKQNLPFRLDFSQKPDAEDLLWHRLRYSVSQENSPVSTSGIISLSEIMPELFDLQISAPEKVFAGMKFTSHILALHPVSKKPIRNVEISGKVSLELNVDSDEDELEISANGKTNDEGFVTLNFEIPANAKLETGSYNGEIEIEGKKNGITRKADEDLEISMDSFVYLNTDKPIYQPNQKLSVRGLFLNFLKKPVADAELVFTISDDDDETVYTNTVKTSRFGVSSIEWQIPENIKLGNYKVEVENDDSDVIAAAAIKITRYDLPNFKVSVKTDRTFYLPAQTLAEITVNADYLFGKQVEKGRVKIVREFEGEADEDEEEAEEIYEGETDAAGKFTAKIDLTKALEKMKTNEWKRFEDLKFAAYFTDGATNRTELKRFDVRLSKEAIHIYFFIYGSDVNPKLPFHFYVSTFFADGTPARSAIKIKGNYENLKSSEILAEAKTNAYGASKFEIRIPEKPFANLDDKFILEIFASDKEGNSGSFSDNLYIDENEKQIFVKTDKTIYLPNEAIEAQVLSSEANNSVFVDVLKNSSVIYSKRISVKNGKETLRIPFRPDFEGELTIAAYFKDERYNPVYHAKTVIFPSPNNLNFNLKSLKTAYRPGEEAKLDFRVRDARSKPVETALGIVVLDKAIEERALIERVGSNFALIQKLLGTAESFGNLTRRDLNNLDLAKPISADFQLAAEFLLVKRTYRPQFFDSDSYRENFSEIYKDYFVKMLEPLASAIDSHYKKTGEFPSDEKSLRRILLEGDINFDNLRDAWGMPFQAEFEFDRTIAALILKTSSADKKFDTADDFVVKRMTFQRFAALQNKLNVVFNNFVAENKTYPKTVEELKTVFKNGGIDLDDLRDEWNRPFYLTASEYEFDTTKNTLETIGNLDGENQQVVKSRLVRQKLMFFRLRSAGKGGVQGQFDNYDAAFFSTVLSEINLSDEKTLAAISKEGISNSRGAIGGTLVDPMGAVIPGATITAENQRTLEKISVTTNYEGFYLIENLPSGKYIISASMPGFQVTTVHNVVVSSMNLITLNITLEVGHVTSVVEVTSGAEMTVNQSSSAVSTTVTETNFTVAGILNSIGGRQISTPRLREYFPETLVWQPEIITDKRGRASFDFKLADSLTTWKLYAIGSTASGEIGLIEQEIQTFQPFFAELDPPKILTTGDEISLPVPIRNYTDKRQKVAVSMTENDWSTSLNGATRQIEIEPNRAQNAIFNFRADSPVTDAKQRITAIAKDESDAVEKTLTVKPNGREIVQTQSAMFSESGVLNINFPENAFADTKKAELKIYPNMLAHVAESVEGLLKRPYGCGEQTVSSTYPNLLILKLEKDLGKSVEPRIKRQAEEYLRDGYNRLLNYQTPGGGFSFWGKTDTPKVALTAYVLRFLTDAEDFIEIDEKVIENANRWLLAQQNGDGSWENNAQITSYIVRTISINSGDDSEKKNALTKGFEYLKTVSNERQTPYILTNFALALIETGDLESAEDIAQKLKLLAKQDQFSTFWESESTPFYGWGKPANIETTALVLQVFINLKDAKVNLENPAIENRYLNEISAGLRFLLDNKDKYGVWHSTQTTVNVLDSLILFQKSILASPENNKAEIYVNGAKLQDLTFDENTLANPIFIDLSSALNKEANRIEIKTASKMNLLMAQIVAKHFIDWKDAETDSNYFDLQVNYDKLQANIGEEITCAVRIERKNYNRNGMILAEIGIPPGADVDRASLEKALNKGISRYDVLPDKIVIYAWIAADPVDFSFKFKPRYGINAQTPASIVYDYYNPQAEASVAPSKFLVK